MLIRSELSQTLEAQQETKSLADLQVEELRQKHQISVQQNQVSQTNAVWLRKRRAVQRAVEGGEAEIE